MHKLVHKSLLHHLPCRILIHMKANTSILVFIVSVLVLAGGFLAVAVVLDMTSREEAFETLIKLGVVAGIFAVMAIALTVLQRIGK